MRLEAIPARPLLPPRAIGRHDRAAKPGAVFVAVLLGVLLASLGSLTGTALAVVPPVLAVILAVVAAVWFKKCHPTSSGWLREFLAGVGLGAAILAILTLVGIAASQLIPFLCALTILSAIAYLLGRFKT